MPRPVVRRILLRLKVSWIGGEDFLELIENEPLRLFLLEQPVEVFLESRPALHVRGFIACVAAQ
jgi:hypothetical protein